MPWDLGRINSGHAAYEKKKFSTRDQQDSTRCRAKRRTFKKRGREGGRKAEKKERRRRERKKGKGKKGNDLDGE